MGKEGLCFVIHQKDERLNRLGKEDPGSFLNVLFAEVLKYVKWYLKYNSLFVIGNRVWDQIRGVAIRGLLSTQLASVFLYD